MEVQVFSNFRPWFRVLPSVSSSPPSASLLLLHRRLPNIRFRIRSVHRRRHRTAVRSSTPSRCSQAETAESSGDFWTDSKTVEVIGIGSRKDAFLTFCLDSPFQYLSLRFWSVVSKDSMKVLLQRRILGKDPNPIIFEALPSSASSSKTIILVASAGYGMDHKSAIDVLETVRSANGFTVAIILKPFIFEGQRRQNEVKELMEKLHERTNLIIDLDTEKLLKKDMVTLDEAVKTANNAVLLATAALAALKSDLNRTIIVSPCNTVKYIEVSEVFRILERYKEAKLGFGSGYNIKSSISQAIHDCPFLSMGVKDLDGIVICILTSSDVINESDIDAFLQRFRQTAEYSKEIIVSTVQELNLEPNLLVTTILAVGTCITEQEASQKSGLLTRLGQRFPFILGLLGGGNSQSSKTQGSSGIKSERTFGKELPEGCTNISDVDAFADGPEKYSEKRWTVNSNIFNDSQTTTSPDSEVFEGVAEPSDFNDLTAEDSSFQREELVGRNSGLGYQIAREWAKERATEAETTSALDKLSIFCLPVGVRPSEESKDRFTTSSPPLSNEDANMNTPSLNELTDTGIEAVKEFYNTASALLKANSIDPPKKQGILSARAASMLEAERDTPKKWNASVEMKYRGGVFKGRCQGGLPEGKGRLVFGDGSIYDGIWRNGKRSGSGTLYFGNGDVFQGSWRDDVMHGKGWFYFHTGDRWFANFWKGKANGEGRFYSKSGDVLFGHFQDGWRHGKFTCIDVDGKRYAENWDHGVLTTRFPLNS